MMKIILQALDVYNEFIIQLLLLGGVSQTDYET